jgi:hypothetical protein
VHLIAWIDTFRRIADGEVASRLQVRCALEHGNTLLLRRAGIDSRFEYDDVA